VADFEFKAFTEVAYLLAIQHCRECERAPGFFGIEYMKFDPTGRLSNKQIPPAEFASLVSGAETGRLQELGLQQLVAQFEYFFF
jgi:hypothetical protein